MKPYNQTNTSNKRFLSTSAAICIALCLFAVNANAEKADSQKKTKVDAEYSSYDGKTDTKVLKGNVEVTRGTLQIKAESAIDKETPDGGGTVILSGVPGRQVFFRQKRDGGTDLWIEGYADRVEYDKKTEVVKFLANAKVRYLNQQKVTQEQAAEFFSYDSINDVFEATNSSTGKRIPGGGRVTITSEPKEKKSENKSANKSENKPENKPESKQEK